MPLESYGVLKATILDRRLATPTSAALPAAVRCRHGALADRDQCALRRAPSEVAHATILSFSPEHEVVERLQRLNEGWHPLRPHEGLDYVRGGLCKPEQFKALPISNPGANNDLNELFDRHLPVHATVYAFGEPYHSPDRQGRPRRPPEPGQHRRLPQRQRRLAGRRAVGGGPGHLGGDPAAFSVAVLDDRRHHRPRALERRTMPKPPLPDELQALLESRTPPSSPRSSPTALRSRSPHGTFRERPRAREHGRLAQALDHLRTDPRVSLTVLDQDWYRHVSLHGPVVALETTRAADIDRISTHYRGQPYP